MRLYGLIGAPTAEKHVLGRLLGARLRSPVLSVRALIDTEVDHRTYIGQRLAEARQAALPGQLLPTKLVGPLIMQALQGAQRTGSPNAVLVGAPRSIEQWTMLRNAGYSTEVIHLLLPEQRRAHRHGSRHVCAGCAYPLYPPEDEKKTDTTPLVGCGCQDGTPDPLPPFPLDTDAGGLARRNAEWETATVPLLEHLLARGSGLHEVKVLEGLDHTWASVQLALDIDIRTGQEEGSGYTALPS
jgi:adenylate kinase family enzyme